MKITFNPKITYHFLAIESEVAILSKEVIILYCQRLRKIQIILSVK